MNVTLHQLERELPVSWPSYLFNQTLEDRQTLQRRAVTAARQQPLEPQRHQRLQRRLGVLHHVKRCGGGHLFNTQGSPTQGGETSSTHGVHPPRGRPLQHTGFTHPGGDTSSTHGVHPPSHYEYKPRLWVFRELSEDWSGSLMSTWCVFRLWWTS